jgi:hypothetical protein
MFYIMWWDRRIYMYFWGRWAAGKYSRQPFQNWSSTVITAEPEISQHLGIETAIPIHSIKIPVYMVSLPSLIILY